jgi:pimeloyl-ACP methyl ester carboxylesterase
LREERVSFPAGGAVLEGVLLDGGGAPLVVSHPHPLHGGTMEHPVVEAIWRRGAGAGFRSLRYNFRGVGASTGRIAPLAPLPVEDLLGAVAFLGGGPALAAGYSYGARVTLHAAARGAPIARAALVGLPTRLPANPSAMSNLFLGRRIASEQYRPTPDLPLLRAVPVPFRVFAGASDPLVEPESLRAHGVEPLLFPGVNHFFSRRLGNQLPEAADLDALAEAVVGFLAGAR